MPLDQIAMDGEEPLSVRLFDDAAWHDHCVRLDEERIDRLRVYADTLVSSVLETAGQDSLQYNCTFIRTGRMLFCSVVF